MRILNHLKTENPNQYQIDIPVLMNFVENNKSVIAIHKCRTQLITTFQFIGAMVFEKKKLIQK